jgi:hypothetical protein
MRKLLGSLGLGAVIATLVACPAGTGSFQISGNINIALQAFQYNDPCGDMPITQQTQCNYVEGPEQCRTACDRVRYEAACSDQSYETCAPKCVVEPKQECTTQCAPQCVQECRTKPPETVCATTCENRCSTSCGVQCGAGPDSVGCSWRCRATCENSCESSCQTVPAQATCEERCSTACSTSCRTVASMKCHEECQVQTYQVCQPKLVEECRTECSRGQGVMVCDEQFVDAENPQQCRQYIENTFRLRVNIGGLVL